MIQYRLDPETHLVSVDIPNYTDRLFCRLTEQHFLRNHHYNKKNPLWWITTAADVFLARISRAHMSKTLSVVPNRIVFGSFQNDYTCNCKYIAEEILKRGLDYELIFLVNKKVYKHREDYHFPSNVYLAKKNSLGSFYALATSKFWFDNALVCCWRRVPKKQNQYYFNTWHGSLGIKRLSGNLHWKMIAKASNRDIDYFLTDSVFDEHVFSESFWPDVKHLKIGHPRNDILFDSSISSVLRQKVSEYYELPSDVKICLYAPTFRDNKEEVALPDFHSMKDSLEKRFGGKWVILFRLHPRDKNKVAAQEAAENCDYIINGNSYPDMQELLAVADAGISDYSSWIFDYIFTGRPAFIYATDIQKYIHDRGFYYPLTDTPFPITDSDEKLTAAIQNYDDEAYHAKVRSFLDERGCYADGKACSKMVDFLSNL